MLSFRRRGRRRYALFPATAARFWNGLPSLPWVPLRSTNGYDPAPLERLDRRRDAAVTPPTVAAVVGTIF